MKLEKYIRQLLLENEVVIVPGFGAFISEYLPAVVDDASGEIKPPSSKLIFNPKLKNNDGLLVGLVAEATRCTHFESLQKIEKARDNILYQLDKGEKVELDELGLLSYNANKEIVLISEQDRNLSLETYGLEATHIEETEHAEEDPSRVEDEENADREEPVEEKEEPTEETSAPPAQESETREEPFTVEKEEAVITATTKEPEEKKKRKGGWIWLPVILIPLIAVSVLIYLKNDKKSETPPTSIQKPVVQSAPGEKVVERDTISQDSVLTEVTDTTPAIQISEEPEPAKTVEMVAGKFYLVGGSFKSEENAETYLQSLREKGFEPFHLGKYGNFFIVGLGTYDTESEALAAKHEYLDKNPGSGVWILER